MKQRIDYRGGITSARAATPVWLMALFGMVSFGYMLPWTSLGGLISYYKETYGADFYLKVHCAYYLPGLPIALLQYGYDDFVDIAYGSRNSYLVRGMIPFLFMVCIIFVLIWIENESALLVLFGILGVCSWLCHGTTSMFCSLYPPAAIAYQQIGFRCPEIFALCLISFLKLGPSPTNQHLRIFYGMNASLVLFASVAWLMLVLHPISGEHFASKDKSCRRLSGGSFQLQDDENQPLKVETRESMGNALQVVGRRTHHSRGSTTIPILEVHTCTSDNAATVLDTGTGKTYIQSKYCASTGTGNEGIRLLELCESELGSTGDDSEAGAGFDHDGSDVDASKRNGGGGSSQLQLAPLIVALGITVWSSIFHASFFAFVTSRRVRNMEQIIYFVRLFSDLAGRPLTFLPRPAFLKRNYNLLALAVMRSVAMIWFFLYLFLPGYPQ
mmetsp:Transcript_19916/g.33332  ORF Transcript_19916/g.33332 Transcript_19916/m.33332 type:complete len:442 (-) Transcript_19916:23-1348(-)